MSQYFRLPAASISATNPSVGTAGSSAPTSATEVAGVNPSGNLNPLHTDGSNNLLVSVSSSALPTGGSTAALQTTGNTSLASIDGKTPALGQQLAAASQPVVLTAAQLSTLTPLTSVTVTQATAASLNATVVGTVTAAQATAANLNATVVGTVTANQGTSNTVANAWFIKNSDGTNTAAVKAASTAAATTDPALVVAISPNNTVPINQTQINGVALLAGQGSTGTGSPRVTIAGHTTGTITSVAGSATSVTLLAANTARAGATLFNDSVQTVFVAFASTATVSAYTVQLAPNGYYEVPATYNGIITGIQSSAAGNVRVTEITG